MFAPWIFDYGAVVSFAIALLLIIPADHGSLLAGTGTTLDSRGALTGVHAVGRDPAGITKADGFALQYRHRIITTETGGGRMGAYATMPLGRFAFGVGYEWLNIPGARFQRGHLSLGVNVLPALSIGISYDGLRSKHRQLSGGLWGIGMHWDPFQWLALSIGVEGLNRPDLLGGQLKPAYVLGLGVRPIDGAPWLTLATETRLEANRNQRYAVYLARGVIDVAPMEGVHAMVAYGLVPNNARQAARLRQAPGHQIWAGVSLALGGLEMRGGALAVQNHNSTSDYFSDLGLQITLQQNPVESAVRQVNRVVEVPLSGNLMDAGQGLFDLGYSIPTAVVRLGQLSRDPTVGTVLLRIGYLKVGLATVDELRGAIKTLRNANKRVTALISGGDEKSYLLAAACDTILMDPVGTLTLDGFSVTSRYFGSMLEHLGIRVQSIKAGHYKTSPDIFTRSDSSEQEQEVKDAIVQQAHRGLMAALQNDRGVIPEAILKTAVFSAQEAMAAGLIDGYTVDTSPTAVPGYEPSGEAMATPHGQPTARWGQAPIIAVTPIVGTIVDRASNNPLPGASAEAHVIIQALEDLRNEDHVAAVVVRIDSPGGDVLASDRIWRAIKRLAAAKPVVISMGDRAASGGYYAAVGAQRIFAEPNTITGSIGVWTLRVNLAPLHEKLHIGSNTTSQGEHAADNNGMHDLNEDQRARLQRRMDAFYHDFVAKVAAARGMDVDEAIKVSNGRVYTGTQAKQRGLVDDIGSLDDAIDAAISMAGLERNRVEIRLPRQVLGIKTYLKHLSGWNSHAASMGDVFWKGINDYISLWNNRAMALQLNHYQIEP